MRDIQLDILRETFSRINSQSALVESRGNARSDKQLLSESKRQFPHLNENQILENRRVLDNINFFRLTVKEIQSAFPRMKFAEARSFQRAAAQFAILEYHSRDDSDNDTENYLKKVNESSKVILELEPFTGEDTIDPNSPEAKQWAQMMAATKGKGPEDTIGPKIDTSSGKEAPEPEKKQGMWDKMKEKAKLLSGLKNFMKKAANFVVEFAKSDAGKRAIAIAAVMVLISVLPGAPILLPIAKGLLGLYGIFKGSTGMLAQGRKLSGGKPGIEGVKEYFKNVSNVKEAASAIGNLASIGLGAWGASKAVGEVLVQVKTIAAQNIHNPSGGPAPTQSAQAAPEAPAQQAPAAPDLSKYAAWGTNKAEELQSAIQQAATGDGGSIKEILNPLAEKIAKGVASGAITKEQGIAALEGLAKGIVNNNGGLPYKSILGLLLKVAKLN